MFGEQLIQPMQKSSFADAGHDLQEIQVCLAGVACNFEQDLYNKTTSVAGHA